jgi:hypothetical protein
MQLNVPRTLETEREGAMEPTFAAHELSPQCSPPRDELPQRAIDRLALGLAA